MVGALTRAATGDTGGSRVARDAAIAVEDQMYRALAILRVILLANAVGLNIHRSERYDHPALGVLVLVGMALWTVFALWAYSSARRRTPLLLIADLALSAAALLSSTYIKGPGMEATIPGYWVMGAMLAWAIHWRWVGGLVAAIVVTLSDVSVRTTFDEANYGNLFLIMIGGPIVGYMCEQLQRMAAQRDEAERAAASAEERTRLARVVHDGVLQVLALVQRRGAELGGEAAELGRLAGEQERALRSLIRQQDRVEPTDAAVDLGAELERVKLRGEPRVHLAAPATPVRLDATVAAELVAVVVACLDNVARHVGASADAWVLVEDLGSSVVVTVRDEGSGIPEGRLRQAVADGRLGISESIRGRMRDLGGSAELITGPGQGAEWELTVPRGEP